MESSAAPLMAVVSLRRAFCLFSSLIFFSCAGNQVFENNELQWDLNLPTLRLNEKEQLIFNQRWQRALALFKQYQAYGEVFKTIEEISEIEGNEVIWLPNALHPTFVVGSVLDSAMGIAQLIIYRDSVLGWESKTYSQPVQIPEVNQLIADVSTIREELLSQKSGRARYSCQRIERTGTGITSFQWGKEQSRLWEEG